MKTLVRASGWRGARYDRCWMEAAAVDVAVTHGPRIVVTIPHMCQAAGLSTPEPGSVRGFEVIEDLHKTDE